MKESTEDAGRGAKAEDMVARHSDVSTRRGRMAAVSSEDDLPATKPFDDVDEAAPEAVVVVVEDVGSPSTGDGAVVVVFVDDSIFCGCRGGGCIGGRCC